VLSVVWWHNFEMFCFKYYDVYCSFLNLLLLLLLLLLLFEVSLATSFCTVEDFSPFDYFLPRLLSIICIDYGKFSARHPLSKVAGLEFVVLLIASYAIKCFLNKESNYLSALISLYCWCLTTRWRCIATCTKVTTA